MAYEYDRYEREDGGGSFLMGLLAGTVLGAGLGMLFAPKAGNELRNQLTESAGRLRNTAGDTYGQATEKVSQIMDRGREAYDRARSGAGGESGIGSTVGNASGIGNTGIGTSGTGSSGNMGTTGPNDRNTGLGSGGSMPGTGTLSGNRT